MAMQPLRLTLLDPDAALVSALQGAFQSFPDVEVLPTRFEEYGNDWDCVIAPGNSFGIMDGGFDKVINNHFNGAVQPAVQLGIRMQHNGELRVGSCYVSRRFSRPGGNMQWGKTYSVAYAPTMRIPMIIRGTQNAYLAMFAALSAISVENRDTSGFSPRIRHVLCPGLGTATGKLPRNEAARQMAVAYDHWRIRCDPQETSPIKTWDEATAYHLRVIGRGEKTDV